MKRIIRILFVILSITLSYTCSKDDEVSDPATPIKPQNPTETTTPETFPKPENVTNKVVAHRGGASEAGCPDNSIQALKYAINLGCYASECDIYITQDNQVVVAHVDGKSQINGLYPWEATYDQIKNAGKLSNGENIPLLEEYLDVAVASKKTKLWIDVKSIDDSKTGGSAASNSYSSKAAEQAAKIIHDKKAKYFVEFIVGRLDVFKRSVAAAKGDWPCAYMNAACSPIEMLANGATWANYSTTAAFFNNGSVVGNYSIDDYTAKGIKVSVYNVDTDADRNWYINNASKLYAICTNYPGKLLQAMK